MDFRFVLLPIILLPLALVVVALAAQAWRGQRGAGSMRSWPQTRGRVIVSEVRQTTVSERRRAGHTSYRQVLRYACHVVYEYEVGGVRYQGDRLQLGMPMLSSDAAAAARQAARYPVDRPLLVYYDPADPAQAVLDPRASAGTLLLWLAALVVLLAGIVVLVVFVSGPPLVMR